MVFCNEVVDEVFNCPLSVTILILIDGFLQFIFMCLFVTVRDCHNPYFNRWFSAIKKRQAFIKMLKKCHNPYFNRWFSAIKNKLQ